MVWLYRVSISHSMIYNIPLELSIYIDYRVHSLDIKISLERTSRVSPVVINRALWFSQMWPYARS